MVGVTNIFKNKEDKQKLTDFDPEKADLDAFEDAVYPNVITERTVKTKKWARLLCLMSFFLFGCFLIISGAMLYKYFTRPRIWYGDCGVKYSGPSETGFLIDHGGRVVDDLVNKPVFNPKESIADLGDDDDDENDDDVNENGEFHQDLTLNMARELEKISVPEVNQYKKATFIHDFLRNWSVIFDVSLNRCFIIPLDRTKISPPKDIFDILKKTLSGYYLPDNNLIHEEMTVVQPPLKDLSLFGPNIEEKCKNSTSYLLKKRKHLLGENHNVDKRDAALKREKRCDFASNFIHSVGINTLAYHLGC